jgi:hypothetical protein
VRNRLLCLVCLALLPAFSFAQQKAPPAQRGQDQALDIPSICEGIDANLLKMDNCGFETGDFSQWFIGGDTTYTYVGSAAEVNSGSFGAGLGPVGDSDSVIHTVPATEGQTFHIEFWLANLVGGSGTFFDADFSQTTLMQLIDADASQYTLYTFGPIPGHPNPEGFTQVVFFVRHDPDYWFLDDVDVELSNASPQHDE